MVLQVVYFYNPAVWLANMMIRRLREQAVDETVLVTSGSDAQRYGNTLLAVAAATIKPGEVALRLIGVVESRQRMASRIRMMVGLPIPQTTRLGIAGLSMIIVIGVALLPMSGRTTTAAPQNTVVADASNKTDSPAKPAEQQPLAPGTLKAAESNLRGKLVDETGAAVTDAEVELNLYAHLQKCQNKIECGRQIRI